MEDSYEHLPGTEAEYQVNNVRVYLFEASSKLFEKSFLIPSQKLKRIGSDDAYNIVYETEHVSVPQGTFDIFVMANTDVQISQTNEADFLAAVDSATYEKGRILTQDISKGIVMTNRATANVNTVIEKKADDADNVVSITLERVLARIDVAKGKDTYPLFDKNGTQYATISLDGYYIVNLPKKYYLYRHVAVLTNLTEPTWSLAEHFGNVSDVNGYVIDPYFFKKKLDASGFKNDEGYYRYFLGDIEGPSSVTWSSFTPAAEGVPQYNTIYCNENCMLAPAQKNGYSTGVVFKATINPDKNVYHLAADGTLQLVTDKSAYPDDIYYFDSKFYDSSEALAAAIGVSTLTGVSLDLYKVKQFEKDGDGYRCYYNYWIRHQDNNKPTVMGVMEFAIVRNLYRILISNVSGLGYPEIPVNPDTPDEGETYLKVVLNVKPWIVRDLTNIVL